MKTNMCVCKSRATGRAKAIERVREQALENQEGALGAKVDALMIGKDRALQSKHHILTQSTRDILKVLSASQLSLERERFEAQLEDLFIQYYQTAVMQCTVSNGLIR
jgi:hypothetical protein